MKSELTEIVMPSDANHLGTCFGGKIMSWIDIAAAVAAQRLAGTVVTASVDSIEFRKPIKIGDLVTLKASVNRVWGSSMEVGVVVMIQSSTTVLEDGDDPVIYTAFDEPKKACKAYLTFVALDEKGKKRIIKNKINPVTLEARHRYDEADRRRHRRLNK